MQTQNPQQAVSVNLASTTEKRIMARVVLQIWGGRKGNDAVYDCEKEIDVTDAILLLDHDIVLSLEDSFDSTDEIGHMHVNHSGPLEVYVTTSICQFFGVESMEDITAVAFEEARRLVNPKPPEFVKAMVEMEVSVKVLPGGDKQTALDNLTIEVSSSDEDVIVTRARRIKSAGERAVVLPAPNPSLPRFMQLMTLSNAVSIDEGPLLTDWTTSDWIGEGTNEVLRFAWTDEEFDYSCVLTEEGVETGTFDGNGNFFVTDHEGTQLSVRFYKVDQIGPSNLHSLH